MEGLTSLIISMASVLGLLALVLGSGVLSPPAPPARAQSRRRPPQGSAHNLA